MKLTKLRVSQAFTTGSDTVTLESGGSVLLNLYDKPAFTTPPVTAMQLGGGISALTNAIAAMAQGGTAATAEKNNRKAELDAMLQELAFFVQVKSNNDMATLLSSGFLAVSQNRAQIQLPEPTIMDVTNGLSGQLLVRVKPVHTAKAYQVEFALLDAENAPGPWENGGTHTGSRGMAVNNLVPGKVYIVRTRAIGGSTGYSDWSDSASHRTM